MKTEQEMQEEFDKIQAIAREYHVPVKVVEIYGDLTIQSFLSTPMIEDLRQEFYSVYYTGENVEEEMRGICVC